ncbi:MAG: pyruvate:ferredoxin (flavodoxin) oxidoreductase [Bacteroidetes bacterium]|nr:pyruvate:ferredoxin (flavodoxin) oxidoreductase [Bacteroidota bacterium]
MSEVLKVMDGNEAVAHVAYKTNGVCAIYPITPSSTMGEFCDEWSSKGKLNIWGEIPRIQEMQSEGGAAGAIHGSLVGGALSTSFTSSQGLLLMIPDMFKIAGELTPFVLHVAARTIATHALSIFGDHSDVMAVRSTGFAVLFASNVQEAMDFALITQASTLKSRIPFINAFDGFRTSHELSKVSVVTDETIRSMIDEADVNAHRSRSLSPSHPSLKGTAQNPDVFFQNREACNKFYSNTPDIVKERMKKFASLTGRNYSLFQYNGHPEAEKVIIIMGSGAGAVEETSQYLNSKGEKLGYVIVHLFRPFSVADFIDAIPATAKYITVLDRTKEPGAIGEPLYQDVVTAIAENFAGNNPHFTKMPKINGGRYGLSSKEFTPAMVKAIYDEMGKPEPKNHFTVGINDDVTHKSLEYDKKFAPENIHEFQGLFYGLGADGTVSANKNSIKIIGESTDYFVQGYFVYDSKKSGSSTVSHLRFGHHPIQSTYLINDANFIACHQFNFVHKLDMLKNAADGCSFLLNAPFNETEVWEQMPVNMQKQIIEKKIKFYVVDATRVAREAGLGSRINTILQTCFFAISDIIPKEEAVTKIKDALAKTYASKGEAVINKNYAAIDKALENLKIVSYPSSTSDKQEEKFSMSADAPEFTKNVLQMILSGNGDELPVSAFPVDGAYPTATTKWEKRNIAAVVPVWDEELCTQCNKCVIICPHAAIRAKIYDKELLSNSPQGFKHVAPIGKEFNKETEVYTLQVAVEDCTGCNLCIEVCPIESKEHAGVKAINMHDQVSLVEHERKNWEFFFDLPEINRERVNMTSVKSTQFLQPLFEFSSACSGCGETPYLKVLTQLFGERMVVANATGCSSIYGANLPTTPWSQNKDGYGPAWANSLFEDNAEFGLGIKLAFDQRRDAALMLMKKMSSDIGDTLVENIITNDESNEHGIKLQHEYINELNKKLVDLNSDESKRLMILSENLVKKSVWIIGGDGWAYDIGYGGLDHVLSTGEKVNILVLDTEVYSNTGGQTSKSTPIGAIAKYSASGKKSMKKNLGQIAITNGNVYVAQIALGANDSQALRAIKEAEAYPGTSLIIAYSHCIAHGFDLGHGAEQQSNAVKSGYWPLFRFNPLNPHGKRFTLDSKEPTLALKDYMYKEGRYSVLQRQNPEMAEELLHKAEEFVREKWDSLKILTTI